MKQQGFTLIEVMATVTLLSVLSVIFWGPELRAKARDFAQVQADVTIEELRRLGSMAQTFTLYNNGDWPSVGDDCHSSGFYLPLTTFDDESPFHTGTADSSKTLPFEIGARTNPELGKYYFSCPENPFGSGLRPEFIIEFALSERHAIWADYMKNQLAGAATDADHDYVGVKVAVPILSALPALEALLPRDGSRPMTGDLDMGDHAVRNLGDVSLQQGQTLGSVPLLHTAAKPGNRVVKPVCPAEYTPQIIVTPKEIAHSNGEPITKFRVWADDIGDSWNVRSEVYGASDEIDSDNHLRVLTGVTVKCAL